MMTNKNTFTFSHILIFLFFTLPFNGNTQTTISNQEKSTLLSLKQHWSNPASLDHWNSSSDHCAWPEITCTSNSVTRLAIINATIAGTIPASICDLANLTHIDLQWNHIPGYFPTVLYNCSNLEYLDLSFNWLIGTIPEDINRLSPRLQRLNLTYNNFTGSIPSAIGGLTNLKSLHLATNLFNGSFPPEIGDLENLEDLDLNYNGFSQQSIPESFTKLTKLKNLWMTETNLIGEIPEGIGNMSALEFVDFSVNGLTGNIPESLFRLKNLTNLFLYKNRLSGSLPAMVEALNLLVLDLSNNTLTGPIPEAFGNLTSLTGLALNFNQLSGKVPTIIGTLPGLVDIKLFSNKFSGELPPDLGRYSPLKTVEVSSNQFVGELPKHLCENKVLVGVIAFDNNLTGTLPDSLSNCSSLRIVRVHDNSLSGKIPNGLWTSQNLTYMMISNNKFDGPLPEKISPNLEMLEIMNNGFSGPIPAGISSWSGLRIFRASNNLLSGEIPQELTELPLLSTLEMDGNRISGKLPATIVSWRSLTTLNLSRNKLSSEIPAAFGFLSALIYLDLSRNELSGQIPPEIGRRLSFLDLSFNQLSGRIPSQFENAAFDSSFSNNAGLCSEIPSLKLPSCHIGQSKKPRNKVSSQFIAAVSSIAAIALLSGILYTIYVYRSYKNRNQISHSTWKFTSFQRKLSFTEAEVLSGLRDDNVIGRGGSGSVYRVLIGRSGEYVAVKSIWDNVKLDHKLEKEFLAEVKILGTIRHSNIVKLLCCISGDGKKLLVYEYMENRSLDRWLHGKKRAFGSVSGSVHHFVLDWPKRLHIAIGAAQGLCYLHHHCSPPIVHRDLKSSNILLDSEFNAKIADFGLARMLIKSGEPNTMSVVAGSFGYMAPEYAQTRRVSEKIDVYSFGVVLLELITGKEAHYGDETSSVADWARRHVQEGKPILDIVDEDIKEAHYMEEINTVVKLGLICTSPFPSSRPAIEDALQILMRCSSRVQLEHKSSMNEHDVAPLLHDSKSLDDTVFTSI